MTSFDGYFDVDPPVSKFEIVRGAGSFQEFPQLKDGYDAPGIFVCVDNRVWCDPEGVHIRPQLFYERFVEDEVGVGYPPSEELFLAGFVSVGPTVFVHEPVMKDASEEEVVLCAKLLDEMGFPLSGRISWLIDGERRQRTQFKEFAARALGYERMREMYLNGR